MPAVWTPADRIGSQTSSIGARPAVKPNSLETVERPLSDPCDGRPSTIGNDSRCSRFPIVHISSWKDDDAPCPISPPRSSRRSRRSAPRSPRREPSAAGRWSSSRSRAGLSPGRDPQDREERHDADDREPDEGGRRRSGKSVAYFVEEADPLRPVNVVRRDERARLYTSKQGLELRELSGPLRRLRVAGAEAVVEPRADSGPEPMNHPGEELVDRCSRARWSFNVDGEHVHDCRRRRLDPLPHRAARTPGATRPTTRRGRSGWRSAERRRRRCASSSPFGGNALIRAGRAGLGAQLANAREIAAAARRARAARPRGRAHPRQRPAGRRADAPAGQRRAARPRRCRSTR